MKWGNRWTYAIRVPVFLCYLMATLFLTGLVVMGLCMKCLYNLGKWPNQVDRGNCWSFAFPKWLVNPRKKYLVVRLSAHTIVPHVFFAESIENLMVEEFNPTHPIRGWKAIIDSFWFKGKIRKGLGEE